jgi:hypothetical protein
MSGRSGRQRNDCIKGNAPDGSVGKEGCDNIKPTSDQYTEVAKSGWILTKKSKKGKDCVHPHQATPCRSYPTPPLPLQP